VYSLRKRAAYRESVQSASEYSQLTAYTTVPPTSVPSKLAVIFIVTPTSDIDSSSDALPAGSVWRVRKMGSERDDRHDDGNLNSLARLDFTYT
jgi:hypothetical protein